MKRHSVTIGDNVFHIRRFDAFTAMEILGDLQHKVLSPMLPALDGGTKDSTGALLSAVAELSSRMDGKTLRALAERLLDPEFISVSISGAEPKKLDKVAVAQSLETASEVLTLCLESVKWNYADFIARWGGLITSGQSLPLAGLSGSSAQS